MFLLLQRRRRHPELGPRPGGGDAAAEAVPVPPHRRQEPLLPSGYGFATSAYTFDTGCVNCPLLFRFRRRSRAAAADHV